LEHPGAARVVLIITEGIISKVQSPVHQEASHANESAIV